MAKLKMPPVDSFGNRFFGNHQAGPAIFPHKQLLIQGDEKHVVKTGKYTALFEVGRFIEHDRGALKGYRVMFDSAEAALEALNLGEW